MEFKKLGSRTYVLLNRTNIGVYFVNDQEVYLIDTGNDKDAGKKILKCLNEISVRVKGIINTHSNADHIGGNALIQERTGCAIYTHGIEKCFVEYPILEPSFLYGGFPFPELRNKFLMAKETNAQELFTKEIEGLSYLELPGHFFDMVGVYTQDQVCFLGDSLFSFETLSKHPYFFVYDIQAFLDTLDKLSTISATFFVPSHGEVMTSISSLITFHREIIQKNCDEICDFCKEPISVEKLLQKIFTAHAISMDVTQYVLMQSTLRSYLSYLYQMGRVEYQFLDYEMLWHFKVEES